MYRYTNVASSSHSVEYPHPSSTASNSADIPKQAEPHAREVSLSETSFASRTVSSSRVFEVITIKDHAVPLTLAPSPAIFPAETEPSSTISRIRSNSSPGVLALGIPSTPSSFDNHDTSSEQLTEISMRSFSTADAGVGSTTQPSISTHTSEAAPIQTSTTSSMNIGSSRTTGIIIGSVLGGVAVLLIVILAIIYVTWRRRTKRQDQIDREEAAVQQKPDEVTSGNGNNSDTAEERKRSIESPMTLPLQGATTPRPRTLRSEPIIVDISPITPIMSHLNRWTSEKADIPSPAGHPAIVETQPHQQQHHPLFASTHYDDSNDDDEKEGRHEQQLTHPPGDVSPCSSSSSSPSPPSPEPPTAGAAASEAEKHELGSFLFFDSPSSRSSRRPSTRDSSAPCTALSMPPLQRGKPPRRRHTRAGGAARSRRGSGSSMGGRGGGDYSGASVERFARPPTPPPPLPARSAERSKSLHDAKRPAAWI